MHCKLWRNILDNKWILYENEIDYLTFQASMMRYAIDALDRCMKEKENQAALEENLKWFSYLFASSNIYFLFLLINNFTKNDNFDSITSDEQGGT